MPRMTRLVLLLAICLLAGCYGIPVDRVGTLAKEQAPYAAPDVAWSARGRLSLVLPGKVMSLTSYVRRSAGGELRVAMMDDGGLMACDIAYGESGAVIHYCRDELVQLVPVFKLLFKGSYQPAAPQHATWRSGRLREKTDQWSRWYGGDPLALRYIRGPGWPVEVGDYRVASGLLLPHRAVADGPWGTELQFQLETVTAGEAPPP
jgi:hypothetical protein